ncbi:hypothetical protein DSO10_04465 [Listeria monocytogenes]|uniref:hypothetical protein n=1 Tax=Listeria monocytogenes TaxID=1639 RepID=UPI000F156FE0|nr:hypothetical protein [Listeria monocytogenes]EAD0738581.1 hypothetical protein [Listeria monocytogenes]EAG1758628.1 hypothetical protein [Listeria monocytogenes]MCN73756.1 hypothetical protein [Listeria monocytogenes]TYU88918.1 hypothetical protein FZX01_05235 [Listeria monocytogenes]
MKVDYKKTAYGLLLFLILSLTGNGYFAFIDRDGQEHELKLEEVQKENKALKTTLSEVKEKQVKAEKQADKAEQVADHLEQSVAEQTKENELLERQLSEE